FLPTAADPRITKPTTRFVGRVSNGVSVSGSQNDLRPSHGHLPLVLLLVLSQVSLGSLIASLIASAWSTAEQAGMATAILGTLTALAAMLVAPIHLGRPLYGFRVFLGLRTSWLSREAVLLGKYTPLVGVYLATFFLSETSWDVVVDYRGVIGGMALLFGFAAVFCSAMIYIVTRRALWRAWWTFSQFAATVLLAVGLGLFVEGAFVGDLAHGKNFQLLAVGGGVSLLLVRIGMAVWFRRFTDGELSQPLVRSAKLLRGRLVTFATWRELLWGTGGGLMIMLLLGSTAEADLWIVGMFLIATSLLLAETLDRFLYFAAESTPTMPGQPK
ncbi:MAG: DmsC/YnfH family molybdoenzyme membrane anchor subunit, partial [Pirellulaceae bacterium]